jgi:sugar/nucleoside kinase (ribokinase family)
VPSICLIGYVTRDVLHLPGRPPRLQPGGAAHYAGVALAGLGCEVTVLTRLAEAEADELLAPLRAAGAAVICRPSETSTVFENSYGGPGLDERSQAVTSLAAPFTPADLSDLRAGAFHLGPLTNRDMDVRFLRAAAARGGRVSLDVQGFLRAVEDGAVRPVPWPDKAAGLAHVDILKADRDEARLLAGEADPESAARAIRALGPQEVLVTLGAQGSLVLAADGLHRIPAVPPRQAVDPTGCGDSFCAGYLFARLRGDPPEAAGRFAAALAALKLARAGPFTGTAQEVEAVLGQAG